jgi:FkbM family methyltransferase
MTAVDVGANAGFYTLAFASRASRVFAIEPFPENARNIIDHLRLNAITNTTLIQAAASNRAGMAYFQAHQSNSMGKLTIEPTQLLVPTVALDDVIDHADIVKIDVEGAELNVLRGAKRLLSRKAIWLVALDGRETRNECRALLSAAGYRIENIGSEHEIVAYPRD